MVKARQLSKSCTEVSTARLLGRGKTDMVELNKLGRGQADMVELNKLGRGQVVLGGIWNLEAILIDLQRPDFGFER